jgi:hypothetical protein
VRRAEKGTRAGIRLRASGSVPRSGVFACFFDLSTFNFQLSTFNFQLSTFNFQLSTGLKTQYNYDFHVSRAFARDSVTAHIIGPHGRRWQKREKKKQT